MALQHLRSSTAHKRPIPTVMSAGQIAINTNEASPALFFKDSNGDLVKVGPVHIGTDAPNSSPASVAATALVTGTVYQILTVGTTDFTLVGASANTVGTIFTATGTTTGTGTVSGQQGVEKGEMWLDTTGGTYVLKIYDGSAWRSESGTFVDSAGDTMTGALLLDNAASASAPDLSFDGDANTGIYSPGADQLALATNGTGRLFVASNGHVGINEASPEDELHITQAGNSQITIENTSSSCKGFISAGSNFGVGSISNDRFDIFTNNALCATFDSSGRLGVGTSSPAVVFDARGTGSVANIGNTDEYVQIGTFGAGASERPFLRLTDGSGGWQAQLGGSASNGTATFNFFLNNVGIGLTSPSSLLHISGSSAGMLRTDRSTDERNHFALATQGTIRGYIGATSSNCFEISDNVGASKVTVTNGGNVGVGTTSPSSLLSLSGASPKITLTSTSTNADSSIDATSSFGSLSINADENDEAASSQIVFNVDGSPKVSIKDTGNVGIGTTSPGVLLDVAGSNPTLRVKATTANTEVSTLRLTEDNNYVGAYVKYDGSTNLTHIGTHSAADSNSANDNNAITIVRDTRNVGIGTSSTGAKLHVAYASGNPQIIIERTTSSTAKYGLHAFSNTFTIRDEAQSTERLRIDSSGNVGIGTSAPYEVSSTGNSLNIANTSSSAEINFLSATTGFNALYFGDGATGTDRYRGYLEYAHNGDYMRFATATVERMRIDSSGNVGIGTTSPANSTNYVNLALSDTSGGIITFMQGATQAADIIGGSGLFLRTLDASPITFRTNGSNERMRIDSSGRLLVGTSSAVNTQWDPNLQVVGTDTPCAVVLARNDATVGADSVIAAIRVFGNDSNGSYEECAQIAAVSDGDHATGDKPTRLVFSTTADGASSPTEHVRINSAGTTTVWSTSAPMVWGRNETSGSVVGLAYYNTATSTTSLTGQVFRVMCDGDVENANNSYGAISDIKLKENIVDASSQWGDLKALQVRNYNFKPETGYSDHTQIGLVAQEVELVSPGLVSESPDVDDDGNDLGTVTKTVNYSVLYMKAVKALQEAMERIETLEQRLSDAGIA